MNKQLTILLFAVSWLLIITVLLCTPGQRFPKSGWMDIIWFDKWVHIFLFMILVYSWSAVLKNTEGVITYRLISAITILAIIYGVVMEVIQETLIPNRSFELYDILADAVGCLIGFVIARRRWKNG